MTFPTGLSRIIPVLMLVVLAPAGMLAQSNFVYTNNDQFLNTVSGFSVASSGTLTPVPGTPFATGGNGATSDFASDAGNRVTTSVAGNFLFASNALSNNVSVFAIDRNTGALTPVPGSPFSTGNPADAFNLPGIALAVTPDDRFLMAANSGSDNISVFSIGPSGALSPVSGSPFSTAGHPYALKITPDGKFLALTFQGLGVDLFTQAEMFSIASSGSLTSLGTLSVTGTGPGGSASFGGTDIDCGGKFIYFTELGMTTIVHAYSIGSDGALTPVSGSPFKPGVGRGPNALFLSADDKSLYVSARLGNAITGFHVALDGSLSLIAGSPFFGTIFRPAGMATSADGSLLYAANFVPAGVTVFSIGSDSTLTEVTGSPFLTGFDRFLSSVAAFPPKSCPLAVSIEIKPPASAPVVINPGASGKIPVAILSTISFNAVTEVDPDSLTFGHNGTETSLAFCNTAGEDVNGDGLADLVCHFNARDAAFERGDSIAVLKGKTFSSRRIAGSETIKTVPQ